MKSLELGGWSFEPELLEFVLANLSIGSTILELGSGAGTGVLSSAGYRMYSIEHNQKFINKYNSTYIYAPMVRYWYDKNIVKENLPLRYDAILIDGPVGSESKSRIGFYENLALFDSSKMMIFDDTNRSGERFLFECVLSECNQTSPRKSFEGKTFSVIYAQQ